MTSFDTITFEVAEHVATITLNRPEALNAINTQMQLELKAAWDEVHFNDDIHAVLLTAAGDRAFCVGADRSEMTEVSTRRSTRVDDPSKAHLRGGVVPGAPGAESTLELNVCPKSMGAWKPVITAVNGIACGGAFYMLGESDIIIAAEHATFFDPHVTFGMVAGYESVHMLQRMPLGEVLRMQLMGSRERLSAERAHQIGLVSEIVPADRLHEAAWHVASTIAGYAPGAVQGTLRAIWAARELPRSVAMQLSPQFIGMASLEDWAAGQRTFESGTRAEWRLR